MDLPARSFDLARPSLGPPLILLQPRLCCLITDHSDVLRSLHDKVSSTINAQSVAREIFQSNALTVKELQSVQSKHSEPVKAAEQLLDIVMNQSDKVYSCFLDALKKTGHQAVFEVIISGRCKGYYDVFLGFFRTLRISKLLQLRAVFEHL